MPEEQRTDTLEKFVKDFSSYPLVSETVHHSVKYSKRGLEKEVCDILLVLRNECIVISIKGQADPTKRRGSKLEYWCAKASRAAANQLVGAVKTFIKCPMWSIHDRRGRVDFDVNGLQILHLCAAIELSNDLPVQLPSEIPLNIQGIPINYLTTNDILNLLDQSRTFPEFKVYLDERQKLPKDIKTTLGVESNIYEYYLLRNGVIDHSGNLEQIKSIVGREEATLAEIIRRRESDAKYSVQIEHVADSLSNRDPNYAEDIPDHEISFYDADSSRKNYLILQENLCDLRHGDRRCLGKMLYDICEDVKNDSDPNSMMYRAFFTEAKPNFVYIICSSKGINRNELFNRIDALARGALAHFQKDQVMIILDRDRLSYEISLRGLLDYNERDIELGRSLFGHLKIETKRSSF
jgi:hypothetical protein